MRGWLKHKPDVTLSEIYYNVGVGRDRVRWHCRFNYDGLEELIKEHKKNLRRKLNRALTLRRLACAGRTLTKEQQEQIDWYNNRKPFEKWHVTNKPYKIVTMNHADKFKTVLKDFNQLL